MADIPRIASGIAISNCKTMGVACHTVEIAGEPLIEGLNRETTSGRLGLRHAIGMLQFDLRQADVSIARASTQRNRREMGGKG